MRKLGKALDEKVQTAFGNVRILNKDDICHWLNWNMRIFPLIYSSHAHKGLISSYLST